MLRRRVPRFVLVVLAIFSVSLLYSTSQLKGIPHIEEKDDRIDELLQAANEFHPKNVFSHASNASSQFTQISGANYAFVAITDARNGNMGQPQVRVLVSITNSQTKFQCMYFNGEKTTPKLYEFSENHRKPEQTFYLNCPLPVGMKLENVDFIIIVQEDEREFAKVPISYRIPTEAEAKPTRTLAICVPFLFGSKYSARHLVEFVELNKLMGVDQITIYTDHSIKGDLKRVLDYYEKEGVLELVNYSLPFDASAIWYYGQLLTVTDCLLRHTGRSKWVAFHDLDEYLAPRRLANKTPINRNSLLEELFADSKLGSLRVPTYYFSPKRNIAPITLANLHRLQVLDTRFTKCVVRPEYVFEQGIHHTSRVIQDDYKIEAAKHSDLTLMHFKNKRIAEVEVFDDYFHKNFGDALQAAFDERVSALNV